MGKYIYSSMDPMGGHLKDHPIYLVNHGEQKVPK